MTIQIDVDEDVQELIRQRVESGAFRDASDVIASALRESSMGSGIEFERFGAIAPSASSAVDERTGADLIAAIQASPYREVELEPRRPYFPPVREVNL